MSGISIVLVRLLPKQEVRVRFSYPAPKTLAFYARGFTLEDMSNTQKFFHDRIVLLLLSVNTFVAVLTSIAILLRLDPSRQTGYIVEYRASRGLNAFKAGGVATFVSFVVFALFVLVFNTILAMRTYQVKRYFAITVLALTTLLLVVALIVSNALLISQ